MSSQIIEGIIQYYDWGGQHFLSQLTARPKVNDLQPWAELWLGAHPKGPATIIDSKVGLDEYIAQNPSGILGKEADNWQYRLPYLLKVLDVQKMLSIQVHPTKLAALAGFEREEAAGIPRSAPNRNYRDDNHKPELGLALTDFYLLHGFKSEQAIQETLDTVSGWETLKKPFETGGVADLYAYVMEAEQAEINTLLTPLANRLNSLGSDSSNDTEEQSTNKLKADFWATRAFQQYTNAGDFDRGIFSIYWFNLVHLKRGEAIFQAAGIPHAYLEGACIELMANSDNVLRGGLTPKHIDVAELMKHLSFEAVMPNVLKPYSKGDWQVFQTPVDDFELSERILKRGECLDAQDEVATIYFVLDGQLDMKSGAAKRGQAIFQPANTKLYAECGEQETTIYRARAKR